MNVRRFLFCIRFRGIKNRILSCLLILSVLLTFWLVQQEVEKTQRDETRDKLPRDDQSVESWEECVTLIKGNPSTKSSHAPSRSDDNLILQTYTSRDCHFIRQERFRHPLPSDTELDFPIAFAISVYKSAQLLEKLLQAIYMPQNIYCIHVDLKSTETFRSAVTEMIRCLPNVFLTEKRVDVIYPHISILTAQFNCMEDLIKSGKDWKYFINVVGQDFPLYNNRELVDALRSLNGKNNIQSFFHPELKRRTEYAYEFKRQTEGSDHGAYRYYKTTRKKSPPPFGIELYKGANHVALTKAFVEYILFNKTARAFIEWLSDTKSPPETFYSSLQQYPGVPGGIVGEQPQFIMRAINWFEEVKVNFVCHGEWVRRICWIDVRDLSWVLGPSMREKLFVQKISFDFEDNLLRCLSMARQRRSYGEYFFP
ncbi:N-acetyllactosaminide beta-1,6-N-acetylglucosaminyl-transferase-like [Oculina patagonica]